jgi:hypothetical protein
VKTNIKKRTFVGLVVSLSMAAVILGMSAAPASAESACPSGTTASGAWIPLANGVKYADNNDVISKLGPSAAAFKMQDPSKPLQGDTKDSRGKSVKGAVVKFCFTNTPTPTTVATLATSTKPGTVAVATTTTKKPSIGGPSTTAAQNGNTYLIPGDKTTGGVRGHIAGLAGLSVAQTSPFI